ncbi:60S ribosomal protein L40, partial [Diaporthe helianthi]
GAEGAKNYIGSPLGYVEFDIDEEDKFGQQGKIVRKGREARERTAKHLSGNAARELYLECLQLILRKQIWWLVHSKGLPDELETVARDLWDLRIRNFAGLRSAAGSIDGESGLESAVDSGTELFSSQAGSESDASTATTRTTVSRGRSWASEPGQDWNLPGLFHCLALCYLACLSMSLPVRVGQVYNWAKDGHLLFLGAFNALPNQMTARLPGAYHRALRVKNTSFRGGELHEAVLELVLDYHLNYEMEFPPLNTPLLLLQYLRELALPAEVYIHVRAMLRLLDFQCTFDLERKGFKRLDHPDILLISYIVFATKLLYPFDGIERPPVSYRDPSSLQIDWEQWRELMRDPESEGLERRVVHQVQPDDAWTMNDKKIDDYLDWYEATQVKTGNESQELKELFPLAGRRLQEPRPELTEDEIDDRLRTAQSYLRSVRPEKGWWFKRTGEDHALYRTPEDLPDVARAFYSKAADLSGLSLGVLLKAVHALELKVHRRSTREPKPEVEANRSGSE